MANSEPRPEWTVGLEEKVEQCLEGQAILATKYDAHDARDRADIARLEEGIRRSTESSERRAQAYLDDAAKGRAELIKLITGRDSIGDRQNARAWKTAGVFVSGVMTALGIFAGGRWAFDKFTYDGSLTTTQPPVATHAAAP